jgi:mRNA-degrading endonuclease toxin of MazEF toxin-antitoxin module
MIIPITKGMILAIASNVGLEIYLDPTNSPTPDKVLTWDEIRAITSARNTQRQSGVKATTH